jgi:hypothetical protein
MIWTRVAALASASLILTGCVGVIPQPEPLWPELPQKPAEEAFCPEPPDEEINLRGDNADPEYDWQQKADAMMAIVSAYAQQLIGFEEDYAQSCVAETDFGWRVTERDGELFPVTMDYRPDRINVAIRGGVVAEATVG